jgi:imidazolonepropionase-like amidohydrolase
MKWLALVAACTALIGVAHAQGKPQGRPGSPALPAPAQATGPTARPAAEAKGVTVAIIGGKVVTNESKEPLDGATVLIQEGRITAIGKAVAIPAGARRIDASGKWVTPGLIAPFSRLGIMDVELEDSANDARVGENPVAAAADAADAFDPAAAPIAVTRLRGVTRAAVAPIGGPSPISGYGAVIDTSGKPDSLTRARAFAYVEAGDVGIVRAGRSRMTLWPYLEAAFGDAAAYPLRYMSHPEGSVLRREEAAAFVPVTKGEIPLFIRVERAADIRLALAFKRRFPAIRMTIVGATEAWKVAPELAAANVPVIIDPLENLPDRFETLGARLDNAALLRKSGVKVAFALTPGSDDGHQVRLIAQRAGNAVANGMTWADAFAAISSTPAEMFGLADLGRLKTGALADVVIWDGDPLEVSSAPEAVFIGGAASAMTSRQRELAKRYLDLQGAPQYR